MRRGKLITFEGVEGAGKTTQLERAAAYLSEKGVGVATAREPGGTAVGEQIREVLLSRENAAMTPLAELYLYLAARAQLVAEVVAPALAAGTFVLLDRYVHSTLAYQGYGLGVDLGGASPDENLAKLRELCRATVGDAWPDLVIVLDVEAEVGFARLAGETPDRIESRDVEFHRRVREGFLALAAQEPERVAVVNASPPEEEVFAEVKAALASVL
ncbi:MAG: dTMP kinase [bacterium]